MRNAEASKKGTGFILIGVLLIAAALVLTLYNRWDAARADRAAQAIVAQLHKETPDTLEHAKPMLQQSEEMSTIDIMGDGYIGTLTIPALNLELPVMADWSMNKLKNSPCRYSGSYYTDDLVIAAHNYKKHFGPLKWVDLNADVYFTTVEGQVYHYLVDNKETLQPTQIEDMITGDWDLTLFTCNMGGQTRYAIRCVRAADE